jgi:hypothetical protein
LKKSTFRNNPFKCYFEWNAQNNKLSFIVRNNSNFNYSLEFQ